MITFKEYLEEAVGGGAGSEITALAESLQAYACAARQSLGRDLTSVDEITSENTKDAYADRKLDIAKEKLDAGWHYSVVITANKFYKDYGTGFEFHRGGKDVEKIIYSEFRKFKKESGLKGEDKWNPADIWAVKKGFKPAKGFSTLLELNTYMYEQYNAGNLIGVSLKKVPKGAVKGKVFNDGKPPEASFKGIKVGKEVASSKDVYLLLNIEGGEASLQLRNFSSRPVTSSWQGELKGKFAAGGKMGGGVLYQAAIDSGVKGVISPSSFKSEIDSPSEKTLTEFAKMFKAISGTNDSIDQIKEKTLAKQIEDKTWWMSKYLSVSYAYAVVKSGKEDEVAQAIYGYASSATKTSSIFVKYS